LFIGADIREALKVCGDTLLHVLIQRRLLLGQIGWLYEWNAHTATRGTSIPIQVVVGTLICVYRPFFAPRISLRRSVVKRCSLAVLNSSLMKARRDRLQQSPQLPGIDTIGGHQGAYDRIVHHLVDGGFGTL